MSALPIHPRFEINPILQKCARSRMRLGHMLSWGLVTFTLTTFICLMTYMTMTEQEMSTKEEAAMAVLPALVVIQGVVLMVFGTGAVASGISQEREEGVLDYQRMTPMTPTAKIIGYMFGLPAREYALFAMTIPFVIVAVIISGFSLLTLLHFYLIFFTSVWIYHMTGLVAGMVSPKPRLASMVSMGMVLALYFILPNLSRFGITVFEFLTIRPTFFGLLQQELPENVGRMAEQRGIDSFRPVPFFTGLMHPTIYTLVVQGFLLVTMFSVVHRKWREESNHMFSKFGGLAVFSGMLVLLMASVWAVISSDDAYQQVFVPLFGEDAGRTRSPESLQLLLMVSALIVGVVYLLIIGVVTPSRHTTIRGWRWSRKLGRQRLGLNSDAASSLPLATIMLTLIVGCGIAIMWRAGRDHAYFEQGPTLTASLALILAIVSVGLFVQGIRECTSILVFGVGLFLIWMVPLFALLILFAAFEAYVEGSYVGLPCPIVLLVFSFGNLMESTTPFAGSHPEFLPDDVKDSVPSMLTLGISGYVVTALAVQVARFGRRRGLASLALREQTADRGKSS